MPCSSWKHTPQMMIRSVHWFSEAARKNYKRISDGGLNCNFGLTYSTWTVRRACLGEEEVRPSNLYKDRHAGWRIPSHYNAQFPLSMISMQTICLLLVLAAGLSTVYGAPVESVAQFPPLPAEVCLNNAVNTHHIDPLLIILSGTRTKSHCAHLCIMTLPLFKRCHRSGNTFGESILSGLMDLV